MRKQIIARKNVSYSYAAIILFILHACIRYCLIWWIIMMAFIIADLTRTLWIPIKETVKIYLANNECKHENSTEISKPSPANLFSLPTLELYNSTFSQPPSATFPENERVWGRERATRSIVRRCASRSSSERRAAAPSPSRKHFEDASRQVWLRPFLSGSGSLIRRAHSPGLAMDTAQWQLRTSWLFSEAGTKELWTNCTYTTLVSEVNSYLLYDASFLVSSVPLSFLVVLHGFSVLSQCDEDVLVALAPHST